MNLNPFEILKNAGKIQEQMGLFQEKLGNLRAVGSSGGGMVQIEMNGRMEIQSVLISEEAMAEGDRFMLADLVTAAFNNAMEKIKETINAEMGAMTGMPGFPAGYSG